MCHRAIAILVVALLATSALAQQADGPSFDCRKAATAVERAICSDPTLAQLDRSIARNYRELLDVGDHALSSALREDQRRFIDIRDEVLTLPGLSRRERHETLQAVMKERAQLLARIDTTRTSSPVGTWETLESRIEVQEVGNGYRVAAVANRPLDARWTCDVEAQGALRGPILRATEPTVPGWSLRLRRAGAVLDVEEQVDSDDVSSHPFCGMNGGLDGIYFHTGRGGR